MSQGIGAYADMKRDDAAAAYKAASDRGDSAGMAAAAADYNNWKEGGDSRAELHVAGGALIGGLGGGSAFGAIGGAAGAGLASKMANSLNDISKGVASATGSDLIGNLAANIAAGVGGVVVGGTAGSAMASNVHLYNQSMDDERQLTGEPGKKSPSLFSLALQGIANGLSAIIGVGGGLPPAASPGVVLAESNAANAVPKAPGYVPGNAILSNGGGSPSDQTASGQESTSPVFNPDGAARAAKNGGNWSSGSLSETVAQITGPNPKISYTDSGKTVYTNPNTGMSVVYDNAGNYYRVQDASGQYLDKSGNPLPNNVPMIGQNKTTQTGIPSGLRQALTHYQNTDSK